VSPNAGEVTASYTVDEQALELTVKMLVKRLVVAHKYRMPAVTWPIHSTDRPKLDKDLRQVLGPCEPPVWAQPGPA